jgi:serine phosphatase RsbU (regulator of sigma subunit)
MRRILICFTIFLFAHFTGSAQATREVLLKQLNAASSDTAKSRIYAALGNWYINNSDISAGDSCANLALQFAVKSESDPHIAEAYAALGLALDYSGLYDTAIVVYESGIAAVDTLKCPKQHASLLQAIANAYYFKYALESAQMYYYQSMKLREKIGDSIGMAASMMGMANVYSENGQLQSSLPLYKTALGIEERFDNPRMQSWILNNIGSIYVHLENLDSALYFFEQSMLIKKELNDQYGLSTTYNNIGEIYLIKKNPRAGLYYYMLSYEIRKSEKSHELALSYQNIGKTYVDLRLLDSALIWLDSAIVLGERLNANEVRYSSLYFKSIALHEQGKNDLAYETLLRSVAIKDSVITEESSRQVNDLMQKYGAEQKEKRIALQNAELESGRLVRDMLFVVIGSAFIIALILLVGLVRKRKTNLLLESKNQEIEKQKLLVEEKNKDIIDSITYAKRIQGALLPSDARMKSLLPDSFVIYKPRDIVSGDFYCVEQWGKEVIVAAIDCTGHGVPGAFMSFMAYDLFQEAVMEHGITRPAAILTRMRSGVTKMLGRENEAVYDGMDAAICTINTELGQLTYSGAHRPLWMFRNGEFIEYKETKCSVGPSKFDQQEYISYDIPIQSGDTLYIFSDGYADQFGGPQGKKFKLARLKQLLTDFHKSEMESQKERYYNAYIEWQNNHEQVDDVLLIGFRIP